MTNLLPEERETILIRNGRGNIYISSNDPTRQKHLLARFGPPDVEEGGNMSWGRSVKDTTFTLPRPKIRKAPTISENPKKQQS